MHTITHHTHDGVDAKLIAHKNNDIDTTNSNPTTCVAVTTTTTTTHTNHLAITNDITTMATTAVAMIAVATLAIATIGSTMVDATTNASNSTNAKMHTTATDVNGDVY